MSLRQLDRDLYCIDHDFRMLGVRLGTRTSVIRLPDGSLVLHGPGPLEADDAAAIDALGPVRGLIGPNLMHNKFLAVAHARWPEASLVAPAALQRKLPQLRIDIALGPDSPAALLPDAWQGALEPSFVAGMPGLDEYAWLHASTGTLILADLAFNIHAPEPWWTRLFMQANGGWNRFGPTRILKSAIRDRALARAGIAAIVSRNFDRVVVAHGDVNERDARVALRASYGWLLDEGEPEFRCSH